MFTEVGDYFQNWLCLQSGFDLFAFTSHKLLMHHLWSGGLEGIWREGWDVDLDPNPHSNPPSRCWQPLGSEALKGFGRKIGKWIIRIFHPNPLQPFVRTP